MRTKNWIFILLLGFVFIQTSCAGTKVVTSQNDAILVEDHRLEKNLKAIPGVVEVNKLETTDHFKEHYEIWFEQHIDPFDPSSEKFKQRVLLAHAGYDVPVIVEIQGYQIWTSRSGELATMFQGNQLTIEHRFFANSKPEGEVPWNYLKVKNAAEDQHRVIQAIKKAVYPTNKFVSTGISKGGQTTMIHRSFYPEDVDVSVCYVAPLNFEREDRRIYDFLSSVGTKEQRKKIKDFQMLCFDKKDEMIDLLKKRAEEKEYVWDVPVEKAFELYVLEYSFAFWQWGAFEFDQIPDENAHSDSLLTHVLNVSGVSFFEQKGVERLRPFFWAALTEIGMYGYQHTPFAEYLSEAKTYTFDFTLPEGKSPQYDPKPMAKVNDFIQTHAKQMMFIYGGLDTWSASAVNLSEQAKSHGLKKYVYNKGHHGTRIKHFPSEEKKAIVNTLESWLNAKAHVPE